MKEDAKLKQEIKMADLEGLNQNLQDINNPLEEIKVASALNSEILKFTYRKENCPQDISILDYTVICALDIRMPRRPGLDGRTYACPTCGTRRSIRQKHDFCHNCGQALDWKEKHEYV